MAQKTLGVPRLLFPAAESSDLRPARPCVPGWAGNVLEAGWASCRRPLGRPVLMGAASLGEEGPPRGAALASTLATSTSTPSCSHSLPWGCGQILSVQAQENWDLHGR